MRGSLLSNRRALQRFRQLAISAVKSAKIKLLLGCCIVFMLILLAGRASDFMGWTNPIDSPLDQFLGPGNKASAGLVFDINEEDSLNNSFNEIKDLKTDAVFSIDDNVIFPCSLVDFAFNVWRTAPNAMLGFVPRGHWRHQSIWLYFPIFVPLAAYVQFFLQNAKEDEYTYGGWWSVWWMGMVLSKAAFFHKKYLRLYTNEMPASIREYITKNRNCEDIAMSFLVANSTGAPPIWVQDKITVVLVFLGSTK